ncbi:helix-turn-helix domain-containing protein [Vibrio parahaemolyticus]|nr:helix-turn-helix domain-containing protein [Vibrio parahaemolyticus]EJG0922979.1 helix-turn-helix domain-containing protein [Vibrio parahaemolyticus O1:K68]EJG0932582.1 helix-turn-helix domain-containing protein [Vibrio parahaemolyticus O1]EJG0946730.1 helix-turn-helix domain-containing protein [Vibrio parahaemolyticus O10]EGQ9622330.1 helix-turn-helix domain-containing protein [Vibrio parahaemolyticus]
MIISNDGHSHTQIVKFLKVSRTSINKWVQTFFEEGPEGLQEKPRTGRPPFLTSEQRVQLSQYVNYHLLKKVALCEPPKRGPLFSPAPIAAALLALASLDVLHIGVLFIH